MYTTAALILSSILMFFGALEAHFIDKDLMLALQYNAVSFIFILLARYRLNQELERQKENSENKTRTTVDELYGRDDNKE